MYMIIDCETTGLPRSWKAPVTDLENWPRVIQLAWALYDGTDALLESVVRLVRPDGFDIPHEAQRVHHISTERALLEGRDLREVAADFSAAVARAEVIVAHNIKFDEKVISAEYLRLNQALPFQSKKRVCTMERSTEYCRIPGPYGYKWPTLSQLYRALFLSDYQEAHDAGADVAACARCFFELKRLGVLVP
ncbi:MAG: 3'-5' exonuclease [Acidobacteria bacterium]|nr:3'-5' exonuclease [Acidobacteriota bacterium]